MTNEQLALYGVNIEVTPNGVWFVSVNGWGRRIGPDEAAARSHAETLVQSGLRQP